MTNSDITNYRLFNQQLSGSAFTIPKELVSWMGAFQAQDYAMSKWAIGIRLRGSIISTVDDAFNRGDILRTHLMRPTWHIVSAENIRWMMELTAPAIRSSMKSRLKELELSEAVLSKCYSILVKLLTGGTHLTREEIMAEMAKEKIATNENRSSHILMSAELESLICSGASKDGKYTYALLDERVPLKQSFTREEALGNLARLYFQSHGPATLQDFQWWSGLRIREASIALELSKSNLHSEKVGDETYWMAGDGIRNQISHKGLYLLPAYDEYMISYKDRSAMIPASLQRKAISENGLFRPVIIQDGQVSGVWKRTFRKDKLFLETEFFTSASKRTQRLVEEKAKEFGLFLGKQLDNPM
jgi:hypothetical protein